MLDSSLVCADRPIPFLPALAKLVGVGEAIVLQQIHFMVRGNREVRTDFKDGFLWWWGSYDLILERVGFFISRPTLIRHISKLEKLGILVSGVFNQKSYDKTKWYRVDYTLLNALMQGQPALVNSEDNQVKREEAIKPSYHFDNGAKKSEGENLAASYQNDKTNTLRLPIKNKESLYDSLSARPTDSKFLEEENADSTIAQDLWGNTVPLTASKTKKPKYEPSDTSRSLFSYARDLAGKAWQHVTLKWLDDRLAEGTSARMLRMAIHDSHTRGNYSSNGILAALKFTHKYQHLYDQDGNFINKPTAVAKTAYVQTDTGSLRKTLPWLPTHYRDNGPLPEHLLPSNEEGAVNVYIKQGGLGVKAAEGERQYNGIKVFTDDCPAELRWQKGNTGEPVFTPVNYLWPNRTRDVQGNLLAITDEQDPALFASDQDENIPIPDTNPWRECDGFDISKPLTRDPDKYVPVVRVKRARYEGRSSEIVVVDEERLYRELLNAADATVQNIYAHYSNFDLNVLERQIWRVNIQKSTTIDPLGGTNAHRTEQLNRKRYQLRQKKAA